MVDFYRLKRRSPAPIALCLPVENSLGRCIGSSSTAKWANRLRNLFDWGRNSDLAWKCLPTYPDLRLRYTVACDHGRLIVLLHVFFLTFPRSISKELEFKAAVPEQIRRLFLRLLGCKYRTLPELGQTPCWKCSRCVWYNWRRVFLFVSYQSKVSLIFLSDLYSSPKWYTGLKYIETIRKIGKRCCRTCLTSFSPGSLETRRFRGFTLTSAAHRVQATMTPSWKKAREMITHEGNLGLKGLNALVNGTCLERDQYLRSYYATKHKTGCQSQIRRDSGVAFAKWIAAGHCTLCGVHSFPGATTDLAERFAQRLEESWKSRKL